MKILKHIRDNVYEVEMDFSPSYESRGENPHTKAVIVAHDYVEFRGTNLIDKNIDLTIPDTSGAMNCVSIPTSLQIDIRTFKDLILPYLNSHEYMQDSHFEDKKHYEDDKFFESNGLSKPRWKKGDSYPAYTYTSCVLSMGGKIHTRRIGEASYDTFTHSTFNIVKNSLQLMNHVYQIKKEG